MGRRKWEPESRCTDPCMQGIYMPRGLYRGLIPDMAPFEHQVPQSGYCYRDRIFYFTMLPVVKIIYCWA